MDNIMTEVLHDRGSNNLGHMMNGPDLVRRFSFGLGMGMNLSWDKAIPCSRVLYQQQPVFLFFKT
jgi:hypothetical protein